MTSGRRRTTIAIVAAALVGGGTGLALGLTEDNEDPPATTAPAESSGAIAPGTGAEGEQGPGAPGDNRGQGADAELPPPEEDPQGLEPGPSGPAPASEDERAAAAAARSYIAAIDSRDAGDLCAAFASGSLDGFDFPAGGSNCAGQVKASLGFEPKGGQPVWESSETTKAISAQIEGDSARVVATVFTTYEDVREPTIEDDIMYFVRSGSSWQLAKPSLTLYRAVGDSDPPPSVLAPPPG